MNPVSVMTMLNCLGYMCFDSMRQPTTDKTRKYNKHANPGEHACSCGGTPFGRGAPDRSSFESWANSVIGTCKWVAFVYVIYRIVVSSGCGPPAENQLELTLAVSGAGYTDLLCTKPENAHLVRPGRQLRCTGTVPMGKHKGKDCGSVSTSIGEKCPLRWCSAVGCAIEQ